MLQMMGPDETQSSQLLLTVPQIRNLIHVEGLYHSHTEFNRETLDERMIGISCIRTNDGQNVTSMPEKKKLNLIWNSRIDEHATAFSTLWTLDNR